MTNDLRNLIANTFGRVIITHQLEPIPWDGVANP